MQKCFQWTLESGTYYRMFSQIKDFGSDGKIDVESCKIRIVWWIMQNGSTEFKMFFLYYSSMRPSVTMGGYTCLSSIRYHKINLFYSNTSLLSRFISRQGDTFVIKIGSKQQKLFITHHNVLICRSKERQCLHVHQCLLSQVFEEFIFVSTVFFHSRLL